MAIGAAVAVGLALGATGSGFLFRYTKNEYEQRITELESYITELDGHLVDMRSLREQIVQFWDDDNAREVSRELDRTIDETVREMSASKSYLQTLRTVVSELDGSKGVITETIQDLISAVTMGISG